ncbi:hypothetical protein [Altererythrobacter sp. ZODW24]|uniref:hypothetical protein n=1 Tax=Altererythrobacter sp. ZODW24 TaxID=2185142 RepID=UPI000DF86770|nr:hypothetical protein [Altererythrobacter sp. ZODW24]
MRTLTRVGVAIAAALSLTACTTVFDEATSAITKTVAPRADKAPDGSYVLPAFSVADDGTVFSTASPRAAHDSLSKMAGSMTDKERLYFMRVIGSLGYYHGCKDRGSRSYIKNPFRSNNLGICNMTTFYSDSGPFARNMIQRGRPDASVQKTMQKKMLVSGAPIGEPYLVGYDASTAWTKWIEWSGHRLDGKTRSELLQEFLQQSKGVYGKYAR